LTINPRPFIDIKGPRQEIFPVAEILGASKSSVRLSCLL
jgi:hypothetical protein